MGKAEKMIIGLGVGDVCELPSSKRKFTIIDERKDTDGNFEELIKFEDDPRHPIWLRHSEISGEAKKLKNVKDDDNDGSEPIYMGL